MKDFKARGIWNVRLQNTFVVNLALKFLARSSMLQVPMKSLFPVLSVTKSQSSIHDNVHSAHFCLKS